MSEPLSVLIIGAGPGGLCTAALLQQQGIEDFLVVEKSAEIGGTWYNNRYPGLACDVCADHYSYSFFQGFDWSRPYPRPAEFLDYLHEFVRQHGLESKIRVGMPIVAARWDDEDGVWELDDSNGGHHRARTVVGAVGMFNEPVRPDIEGLDTFAGPIVHTAEWPLDDRGLLEGKSVAVIGAAASAIQLVPEIASRVGHLDLYQRTPNWVFPKDDGVYTDEEREERRRNPSLAEEERRASFDLVNTLGDFNNMEQMEPLRVEAMNNLGLVADPDLRERMLPVLPIGAQRPLLSADYYAAFNRDNVRLVTDTITSVTKDAVVTADGVHHPADVLVLATGYAAHKFLSVIDFVGRDGVSLRDLWRDGAYGYLGITVEKFPNVFMMYGPNTNGGSIIDKLETQARYIVRKIAYILDNDVKALEVKPEVVAEYNVVLHEGINRMNAWQVEEGSKYYRAPSGRIVTQCGFNVSEYDALTLEDDTSAFDVRARSGAVT